MHSHTARLPTIDAYHLFQLAWIKPLFPGRNTQTCVLCLHYVREADTCESIHHQVFEDKCPAVTITFLPWLKMTQVEEKVILRHWL